jgi:DNA polymerase III alpha subunit (gram-positive type)
MSQVIVTTREDLAAVMAELMPAQAAPMPPEVVKLEKLKRKEYLTTEEVESVYGLNAQTLRKRRMQGEGPGYIKDGQKVLYAHAAVKAYLESRRQKTYDQP